MSELIQSTEVKMNKAIEALKTKFSAIRTGRASPKLVENIMVDYYGAPCTLKSLANIGIPESRTITIQPFDKAAIIDIEKAIQKSSLGINPVSEGGRIILNLPQLTEERRKELTKVVKSVAEEAKVSLRNIRRDALHAGKESSEDAEKTIEQEIEKLIKKFTDLVESSMAAKQKEILEV